MLRVQVDGLPVCHCRDWKTALAAGDEELCHPVVLSTVRVERKTESVRSWTGQYEVPLPWDISPVSIADRAPHVAVGDLEGVDWCLQKDLGSGFNRAIARGLMTGHE